MTAKQRVVTIPGDEPEQGIDGYGGKDFEKRKVLRGQWKTSCSYQVKTGEILQIVARYVSTVKVLKGGSSAAQKT